jgi:Uma2 family endonuclease
MTARAARQGAAPDDSAANPFRYGWRYVKRQGSDGTVELKQVPLTLEDVLHPQEEDVIPERPIQEQERGDVARVFRSRLHRLRGGLVLSDCIIDWNVPGLGHHSPDVSVFERLRRQPDSNLGIFRLAICGGRCLLALEIVSPDTRVNDVVHKVAEYHQAHVPLYIIVDQEQPGCPRRLLAYRDTPRGYKLARLDGEGRVAVPALGLLLGLRDERLVCFDAATGEVIGDYAEVTRAHEAEAKARKTAERRAQRAVRQAQQEAEARARAEQRARDLEAELRRLRGMPP